MQDKFRLAVLIALLGTLLQLQTAHAQYQIELHIDGLADSTAILGYYYGEGKYVRDTVLFNKQGKALFQGDSALAQGMYLMLLPNVGYLEFLLGEEQNIKIHAKRGNGLEIDHSSGSKLLADFLDFQDFMAKKQQEGLAVQRLDSLAKQDKPDAPKSSTYFKEARDLGNKLTEEVEAYQRNIANSNPNNVLGKFAKAVIPIDIPEYTPDKSIKNVDSAKWMFSYNYNVQHYLDHIDLSYPYMLHLPTVVARINTYLDKMILQIPDSLNKYCDVLIEKTKGSQENYHFLVTYLLNKYQTSEIVGMDAVFVHIAEKYYLAGKTPWIKQETIDKIADRVKSLRPNLIGNVAPDFTVGTLEGGTYTLLKDTAPATLLIFWEPSCSHCKKMIPKLDSIARQFEPKGLRIVGFMTQGDGPAWQKYVNEHKLGHWVNVWDPYRKTDFDKLYDIYSTPVMYILDEKHKIVVKRIGLESVAPILEDMLGK